MLMIGLVFGFPGVAVALAGERAGIRKAVLLGKGVASAGFLLVAISLLPAAESPYALWILSALGFSLVGDLVLVSRKGLLPGLLAFLLAHLAYLAAFAGFVDLNRSALAVSFAVLLVSLAILRWLWPRLGTMKAVVTCYVIVISLMVAAAVSAWSSLSSDDGWRIGLAAILFYFSDILVARQVFVRRSLLNPAVGLPLYYAAQYLFASTVGRL